ncbi:MAG: hypothetical protein U1F76_01455 [Candidatus Competibacteraceae bacterium]
MSADLSVIVSAFNECGVLSKSLTTIELQDIDFSRNYSYIPE